MPDPTGIGHIYYKEGPNYSRKGVILFIVLGVIIVSVVLATVVLRIISSQSRLTHHQVSRIQALYAAKAGMVLAFDKLRRGDWVQNATAINYYCINAKVDPPVSCLDTLVDTSIHCGDEINPCNVQIAIYPQSQPGINGTAKIEIKTDYTYTP